MKISRRKFMTWFAIGAPLAMLLDGFFIERFFVETREYFLTDKSKNNKLRILQLSDLHLKTFDVKAKALARKINDIKPDLLLITGDAIDKKENIGLLNEFLDVVDDHIPKAAILGNWEYWGKINIDKLRQVYSDHNCTLLINETKQFSLLGKTISITGTDDFVVGNADIAVALQKFISSDYHIILNHCPEYNDIINEEIPKTISVDLILSGHTHGGQINLFGFIPFLPVGSGRFVKGWYKKKGSIPIYVSKGVGTSIFPARFGARAEIAIFYI
jgi:predicted MPP superfamily phosphohydrolase